MITGNTYCNIDYVLGGEEVASEGLVVVDGSEDVGDKVPQLKSVIASFGEGGTCRGEDKPELDDSRGSILGQPIRMSNSQKGK